MRRDGSWQVEPRYDYVGALSEGRAVFKVEDEETGEPRWGALDDSGGEIFAAKYDWLSRYRNGFAETRQGPRNGPNAAYGLVDKQGRLIGRRYFDAVREPDDEGEPYRLRDDGTWFNVTAGGDLVPIPADGTENRILVDCGAYSIRRTPDGHEARGADGEAVLGIASEYGLSFDRVHGLDDPIPRCDKPISLYSESQGVAIILPDGKLFGRRIFENTLPLSHDVHAFQEDEKWGLIHRDGTVIAAPAYDSIRSSYESPETNLATHDGDAELIELDGTTRPLSSHPDYNATLDRILAPRADYLRCSNNRLVRNNELWGLTDADGRPLIAPEHRALSCYQGGVAWVPMEERRQWCPVGPDGKRAATHDCHDAFYLVAGWSHHHPETLDPDPFTSSLLWNERYLAYGAGDADAPPMFVGDGVHGQGRIPAGPLVHRR